MSPEPSDALNIRSWKTRATIGTLYEVCWESLALYGLKDYYYYYFVQIGHKFAIYQIIHIKNFHHQ